MSTAVRDPLVGQLLDGRYRVEFRLSSGGMAAVYLAVDTRLDRTVALKVMHPGLAADGEFVARFIREAKSAARLSHPHVVAVHDQGRDGDIVFLAMEYVHGQTLRALLRDRGPLPPRQALEILEPVLAALAAAHAAGLVHRDVKPENVLLGEDGRVKVADFGLARAMAATTSTAAGSILGTVAYLSPEQVERGIADPRSDVYAAGIVLYEMLTGARPYDGDSPISVAFRHVHDDVPPPSAGTAGLPVALDDLVAHATRRDPDERPADASAFLADVVAVRRLLPEPESPRDPLASSDPDLRTLVVPRASASSTDELPAYGGSPEGPARRPRRRWLVRLVRLVLLVLLALALTAGWYLMLGPGARIPTPELVGLSRDEAAAAAQRAGLGLRVADEREFSETIPAGEVVRTDPAPAAGIAENGTITAVLSRGPERYAVPDVVGVPRAAATERLQASNLAVGDVSIRFSQRVPTGAVVSAAPAVGERVRPDTAVHLVVSKGREPLAVRDHTGEEATAAAKALTERGFRVAVEQRYDEEVPRGEVIAQQPPRGTAFRGDTVTLVASQGPPLVPVPRVVDIKVDEAQAILEQAGFRVATRGISILGRVLSQDPADGSAPKGSTITLETI